MTTLPTPEELTELEAAARQGAAARFVILNRTRALALLRLLAAYRELYRDATNQQRP